MKWHGRLAVGAVACVIILGSVLLGVGIVNQVEASTARHPRDIFNYIVRWNPDLVDPGNPNSNPIGHEVTINGLARNVTRRGIDISTLTIPAAIDGVPVVAIGLAAFTFNTSTTNIGSDRQDVENVHHVRLPTSVRTIGTDAFKNMPNLATVTLLEGLEEIGIDAFYGCPRLTNITIPSTVHTIGAGAFSWCFALGNTHNLRGIHNLGGIIIPETVQNLGEQTFHRSFTFRPNDHTPPDGGVTLPADARPRLFTEHATRPIETVPGKGWNNNWHGTHIVTNPATSTNPMSSQYPVEWGVYTATYKGANGQVARHIVGDGSGLSPASITNGSGFIVLPTMEELGFVYDHTRYVLHGWAEEIGGVVGDIIGFGGETLSGVDESKTFVAVLTNTNNETRRKPLMQLVKAVEDFVDMHDMYNVNSDNYFGKLWDLDSWFELIDRLDEAQDILGKYDDELAKIDIDNAYRDLFEARIMLKPFSRDDDDIATKHDIHTRIELLELLVEHSAVLVAEKQYLSVSHWTWVEFRAALDDAEDILLPARALLVGKEGWLKSDLILLLEGSFELDEVEDVFFTLVEAVQAVTVRYRPTVDILIWLGALFIIIAMVGFAGLIDMFGGRRAIVKIERPWTTYG